MGVKERLLTAWDVMYDTEIDKIAQELSSDDQFQSGSGGYIEYAIKEEEGPEALEFYENEMPEKEKEEKELEIIEKWVRERWADFEADFKQKADEENLMLKVTRCIAVEDAEEFLFFVANQTPLPKYKGLGVYWAWDKDRADCHWRSHGGGGEDVLVHALIPFDSIDVRHTLMANLSPSTGREEAEIYLKEGSDIFVKSVQMPDDQVEEAPEPLRMTASTKPYPYRNIIKVLWEG